MNESVKIVQKKLIGLAAYAARYVSKDTNSMGWPPVCMGILYQPKRPLDNQEWSKQNNEKGSKI